VLGVPAYASAQTMTDALSAAGRTIDWSHPGVSGGIPNRTNVCTTVPAGASAATINTAIAACSNGVVLLSAGTYALSSGITFRGANNVTLRGAGPDQTVVRFTGADGCGGLSANICIHGPSDVWSGNVPTTNIRSWTAGYEKGSTRITLDSASGLSVGQVVILDQADDASDTGGVFVCGSRSCSQEGVPAGRPGRAQQQYVQVTAISGNQVTISPGVYMPNWRASQTPQMWWWGDGATMNGVEAMTLDHSASPATTGIGVSNAYNCWIKNVKSLNANRNHVWLNQAARIEVRDNYFYGTKNAASLSYGVELYATGDDLVMNNIFEHVTAPIMTGNSAGVVVAYNFMTDMYYTVSNWMMAGVQGSHDAGTGMNLFESNVGNAFLMDNYHGTGNLITVFRNRLTGTEGTKTSNTIPVNLFGYNRFVNIVGNVLGTAGYHQTYEFSQAASAGSTDRSIYVLGYSGVGSSSSAGLPYDSKVLSTLLRWGNFDVTAGGTQWKASEVPSGVTLPPSNAIPPSLFLASRPGWWGAMPWPAIGPDVTGGPDGGGYAYAIPAQACFRASGRKSDGTLTFDPKACYPETASTMPAGQGAPSAPVNFTVR
jgi:hypothetical protein